MDIVNLTIEYLKDFAIKSESIYHVNPWLFGILFFGSAIPLYFGYFLIARSFVRLENKKIVRKKVNRNELHIGVTVSVIAWWIPYVYVFIFGTLPIDLMIIFVAFLILTGVFFVKTLRDKIITAEK